MNLFRRKPADKLQPNEQVIACPDCASTRPAFSLAILRNWVRREGQIVALTTGERVSCQDCGSIYSIGPSGVFRQHRYAYPMTPQPVSRSNGIPEPEPIEERPLPPLPRSAPRL